MSLTGLKGDTLKGLLEGENLKVGIMGLREDIRICRKISRAMISIMEERRETEKKEKEIDGEMMMYLKISQTIISSLVENT